MKVETIAQRNYAEIMDGRCWADGTNIAGHFSQDLKWRICRSCGRRYRIIPYEGIAEMIPLDLVPELRDKIRSYTDADELEQYLKLISSEDSVYVYEDGTPVTAPVEDRPFYVTGNPWKRSPVG